MEISVSVRRLRELAAGWRNQCRTIREASVLLECAAEVEALADSAETISSSPILWYDSSKMNAEEVESLVNGDSVTGKGERWGYANMVVVPIGHDYPTA